MSKKSSGRNPSLLAQLCLYTRNLHLHVFIQLKRIPRPDLRHSLLNCEGQAHVRERAALQLQQQHKPKKLQSGVLRGAAWRALPTDDTEGPLPNVMSMTMLMTML